MAQLADTIHVHDKDTGVVTTPRGWWNYGGVTALIGGGGLARRDDTDGTVSPCQRQDRLGRLVDYVPVDAGSRTIKVWCKHSGHTPRPRIVVKANLDIGVQTDVTVEATASTAWQELSVSVTVAAKGALEVWREVRAVEQSVFAKWDDYSVT